MDSGAPAAFLDVYHLKEPVPIPFETIARHGLRPDKGDQGQQEPVQFIVHFPL